jgi:hypothetical protein
MTPLEKSGIKVTFPDKIKTDYSVKYPEIEYNYISLTSKLQDATPSTLEVIWWLLKSSPKIIKLIYAIIKIIEGFTMSKDLIATIIGVIGAVILAVQTYIQTLGGGEINWWNLALAAIFALLGYFTNKKDK